MKRVIVHRYKKRDGTWVNKHSRIKRPKLKTSKLGKKKYSVRIRRDSYGRIAGTKW